MHPLALLAVLRHERRLGHAMQRPRDRTEHAGRKQDTLVDREDRDEVEGRTDAVADDERPLPPDAVRDEPGRDREDCAGDAAEQEAQTDELDREADGKEIEVHEDEGRTVDGVHADHVDDEQARVPAEASDRQRVLGEVASRFHAHTLLRSTMAELAASVSPDVLRATHWMRGPT